QLEEQIVRDAKGQLSTSHGLPAERMNPRIPKKAFFVGLTTLIILVVIAAVAVTESIRSIADPDVAKTAILSFVIGLVVLVFIIGVVVISVAGIIWGRQYIEPKIAAEDDLAKYRVPTPVPAAAHIAGPRQCPVCEGMIPDDSPEGLCPKCLL